MLIILTKSSKLNILYFEGFKEFKAIAVTGNVFSICSQEWNLISHVRVGGGLRKTTRSISLNCVGNSVST